MTFWSGDTLETRLQPGVIVRPFNKSQIDCAAYTLRMGSEVYVTPDAGLGTIRRATEKIIDSKKPKTLKKNEHFIIPPGQFAWLLTHETLKIPKNVLAFISLKTTYKFKGLINVSGFHVDPGFQGNLVYGIYNAGPQEIRLAEGKELFLIWFADLDAESKEHHRKKPPQERIHEDFLVSGEILSLQNLQGELYRLDHKLTRIVAWAIPLLAIASIAITAVIRGPLNDWVGSLLSTSPPPATISLPKPEPPGTEGQPLKKQPETQGRR